MCFSKLKITIVITFVSMKRCPLYCVNGWAWSTFFGHSGVPFFTFTWCSRVKVSRSLQTKSSMSGFFLHCEYFQYFVFLTVLRDTIVCRFFHRIYFRYRMFHYALCFIHFLSLRFHYIQLSLQ